MMSQISPKYGGQDQKRFQPIYEFLNTNIGLNRLEPHGIAETRLKEFLLTWSSSNALSENIRFKLMKEFRLDFHVQSVLPPLIIAYSDVSGTLTKRQRVQVGKWINRLVEQSQKSDFYSRQDNKAYLRHLTALLWGIVVDNEGLIEQARQGYQNAIFDMRPDGGSNGSIDNPNMNHLDVRNTGESDISRVALYMKLTDERPAFLSKKIQDYKGYWNTAYGPQSCVVAK